MSQVQTRLHLPVRKASQASCEAKPWRKGRSCPIKHRALDENSETRSSSKRALDFDDVDVVSPADKAFSLSPEKRTRADKGATAPLSLSKPDVGIYQKAKRGLTAASGTRILGRTHEMQVIRQFLERHLRARSSGSMYLSGAPGTGKTACLSSILQDCAKASHKFSSIFVNCMTLKSSASIYDKILEGCGEATCGNRLEEIKRAMSAEGPSVVVVLDEVDQLDSRNQTVLYSLFELPRLKDSRLILFGIANALDLTDRAVPHLQAYGCRPELLHFAPYSQDEIASILKDRLLECGPVVQPLALQFCARKVAACTGDIRKALDVCRRAVELVERDVRAQQVLTPRAEHGHNPGSPRKLQPKVVSVGLAHISAVLADSLRSTGGADLDATLPLQQKLLLCTVLVAMKAKKLRDIPLGKLQEAYKHICNKHHAFADQSDFSSLCALLEARGLIRIKKHKELRLSKASLRIDEQEVEHVLQDKALLASCLADRYTF